MALVEALGLLAVVGVLVYLYVTRNYGYWAKRGITHDKPIFFLGNFYECLTTKKNIGQVIEDTYRKYKNEKVVGMYNFMKPALLVCDPALVTQILTTDFHKFADNDFEVDEKLDPVLAKNIFVQTGEKWKRRRQTLSPAFTIGKIKSSHEKMQNVAEKLVEYLKRNPEPEGKSTMSLYTSEIVATWGIGIDGHCFDDPDAILPKLGKMMFSTESSFSLLFSLMSFFPIIVKIFRVSFVPKDVPEFFDGALRALIDERTKNKALRKDFLQYFMDLKKKRELAKNDDQDEITDEDIISSIVTFFIEGYETSSLMSALMLFHLVLNPKVQKELREEVDALFEKSAEKPSLDDILELPYLNKVYMETLRVTGVLNMAKRCTQECTLDLGNGKTLKVEKGMSINISVSGLHNDPEYWSNPEKFDPDRFENYSEKVKGTFLAFGAGPRICIGMRVAQSMIKTAIVNIIRNFELLPTKKTAPKFEQDPRHFMISQKGGIHIRFSQRNL